MQLWREFLRVEETLDCGPLTTLPETTKDACGTSLGSIEAAGLAGSPVKPVNGVVVVAKKDVDSAMGLVPGALRLGEVEAGNLTVRTL